MIIIDASLAVKWYLAEKYTKEALSLLDQHIGDIAVPDIFLAEVMGALVRRANIDQRLRGEVDSQIIRFAELFDVQALHLMRSGPDASKLAAKLALDLGHPLKDCLYLALAMELDCPLVTADARFAAKAKAVYPGLRLLEGTANAA